MLRCQMTVEFFFLQAIERMNHRKKENTELIIYLKKTIGPAETPK